MPKSMIFLVCFVLISGCGPPSSTTSGLTNSAGVCSGEDSCGFLSIEDCKTRTGCWVDTFDTGQEVCKENPPQAGAAKKLACSEYSSENSCINQGGCFWTDEFVTPAKQPTRTIAEKLFSGTEILRSDFDGDGVAESVMVSDNQNIIGIVKDETGNREVVWYTEGWVNHEDSQGKTGWNLGEGDNYFPGDFDGDGKEDLVIWSKNGEWIGILKESQGKLVAGPLSHNWINHIGQSGRNGWNLDVDDTIWVGQFYGDQRTEILIRNKNRQWVGIIEEDQGKLVAGPLVNDWVNYDGGTGNSGWNLRENDTYLRGDFNDDGQEEIAIVSPDKQQWIGLLEVNNSGRLVTLWIGNDWVNHDGGTGDSGWNLREGDTFKVMEVPGPDEISVRSGNGKWEGIIARKNNKLYAKQISQVK